MKRNLQLIVCLLLGSYGFACGMELQRPRRDFLSETNQNNRALQRRSEALLYSVASMERSEKEMGAFCSAYVPFMGNLLLPMPLLQLSDTTSCKETICFNPAMANLFWVLFAANTAVLLYEMYNSKPFFTSHKKNMILGGVNSTSSAVIWACASMVDDCPQDNPYCLQARQLFCGLHLLAAGVYLYQASLNK